MKKNSPSLGTLVGVWAALMALLAMTWGVAKFNLGQWNIAAALGIAFVKMLLVVLIFMHIRYSSRLTWIFAAAGFFWLLMLFVLAMSDYFTRIG